MKKVLGALAGVSASRAADTPTPSLVATWVHLSYAGNRQPATGHHSRILWMKPSRAFRASAHAPRPPACDRACSARR